MKGKTCTKCSSEKLIKKFQNKYTECKTCNSKRGVKCF